MPSLEDLRSFNEEVASLYRADVPIDVGVSGLGGDSHEAMRRINAALSRRVQDGESLMDAVAGLQLLPSAYQSVIIAGLQCGNLAAPLELLSRSSRPLQDAGQTIRSSVVYPLVIFLIAYGLFAAACLFLWPPYEQLFANVNSNGGFTFSLIGRLRDWLPYWVAIPPLLVVALVLRFNPRRIASRAGRLELLGWLPGIAPIHSDQRRASIADLAALLVENDVSPNDALRLSARAAGEAQMAAAMDQLPIDEEETIPADSEAARQLPPLVRWAVGSSQEAEGIAHALRIAAKVYRQRAQRNAVSLRGWLPPLLCVVIAGGVTLLYCLAVFGPLVRMIWELG